MFLKFMKSDQRVRTVKLHVGALSDNIRMLILHPGVVTVNAIAWSFRSHDFGRLPSCSDAETAGRQSISSEVWF